MDNFIREVDEEYRRQRISQIWNRFGILIIALVLLVVAGVGGWRYWLHLDARKQEAAATRFAEAVQLSRDDKSADSEAALKGMIADAPAGYRLLARFRLAAELGKSGSGEDGAKAYDAIAADAAVEAPLRDLARIRAAALRLEAGENAASLKELESIAVPTNPWRHSARELLGLTALKTGDFDGAAKWFDQIAADRTAPQNLRGRLEIYSALAAGGPVQTTQ
ncbi:tetratricopeptide repeat protein [Enterovirga rhinocerotis]|uniref:Ancillary SecYEG translocon subunit/Cell division coordinator CpoB TPR domain-containing protein n=1 Tax=Enterovirga rhinocerotis TaxID=1339210 RepID=A0A4R7CA75_9HYPH|nr:tetratricopeptide repeat protein [Enterovirga rhinocerotis]TDR93697.1 hypothetical protein EV668_0962 [Enterovirga rhinocerotis]